MPSNEHDVLAVKGDLLTVLEAKATSLASIDQALRRIADALVNPQPSDDDRYLNAQECAAYLGMTVKAFYAFRERRRIRRPSEKKRKCRFTKEQLDKMMEK
jgi:hypothetical protein